MNTRNNSIERVAETLKNNFEYFLNQAFSPFAILAGPDLTFTFANAAYVELMNGRQLVGKPLDEAIPELKDQPFSALLKKVFDTGLPYHTPEIAATAIFAGSDTPTTRYFNLSYTPFKNQDGKTEGVLASGFDITQQVLLRKREQKQGLNLQAYDLFMEAPIALSLLKGKEYVVTLANPVSLKLTGRGQEIIGKPILEILPEIESQGYIKLLDRVITTGTTINLKEAPLELTKSGVKETLFLDLVCQPYYEDKKIQGAWVIATDVTAQVHAIKEVAEIGERFQTMANNMPNLAWIANPDGWIFWYNQRWYEYTGTTPKEMEGWGWKSVHDPETLPTVLERWQQSIHTGQPFEMVFPLKSSDNTYRPFLTRVIPVKNNEGKIMSWVGTNTDITTQKDLERMKDDFISMASHELKTPLTTIKAYGQIAERILENKNDEETLQLVKRMGIQVDKLTGLVEELLNITKLQKGKFEFKEAFFDLNEIVKTVIEDMQNTSFTHTIQFVAGQSKLVYGDKDKISQVISNLISNAIKYSPNGEKVIVTTSIGENGMQLSVQDFGIGISAQHLPHVFEQFYRVAGERQSTFPGMGIGLFICSEIIALHGGRLWAESTKDKGSVFHTWLPFDHRVRRTEPLGEHLFNRK